MPAPNRPPGQAHVTTPLAQVDLMGGAAMIEYRPGKLGLADRSLTVSCLATICTLNARVFGGTFDQREQMDFSNSGLSVDQTQLSEAQVAALLGEFHYGAAVAATLSAWPANAATDHAVTPAETHATAAPAVPTRTLAPTYSTATPTSPASAMPIGAAIATSATPTSTTRRIRQPNWTPTHPTTSSATSPPR